MGKSIPAEISLKYAIKGLSLSGIDVLQFNQDKK
jgi:hypothetical protein